jgi:predicted DNA-binding protein
MTDDKMVETVTVRMTSEMKEKLDAQARKEQRTTSTLIRLMLEDAIARRVAQWRALEA